MKNVLFRFALSLSLTISAGCGSTQSSPITGGAAPQNQILNTTFGQPGCAPGAIRIAGACGYGADFSQACTNLGGFMTTALDSAQVCKLHISFVKNTYSPNAISTQYNVKSTWREGWGGIYLPRLTPSQPTGMGAIPVQFALKKYDLVKIVATGSTDDAYIESDWKWIFNVTTVSYSCNKYPLSGWGTNLGLANGFVLSDGTQVWSGTSSTPHVIQNDGQLRLGFNLAYGYKPYACGMLTISELTIARCEDSSGQTHACSY